MLPHWVALFGPALCLSETRSSLHCAIHSLRTNHYVEGSRRVLLCPRGCIRDRDRNALLNFTRLFCSRVFFAAREPSFLTTNTDN